MFRLLLTIVVFVGVTCMTQVPLQAKEKKDTVPMAILEPVIKHQGATEQYIGASQQKFNPQATFNYDLTQLQTKESKKHRWPFDILSENKVSDAYLAVVGTSEPKNIFFDQYRLIADKLGAGYVVSVTINELSAYRKTNTLLAMNGARASIQLTIYSRSKNQFVWQKSDTETSARGNLFGGGSLAQRERQALLNCMIKSLDPFAKGGRMKIGAPTVNVIATVTQVLNNDRVILDVGTTQSITVGDVFNSIESNAQIKIIQVFANGSIAEIIKGSPKVKEVFSPASNGGS